MKEYIVLVDESTLEQDELEWFKEQGAKELVRCKDCIHMKDDGSISPLIWCSIHEFGRMNDYFCADAIRKEGR